MNISLLFGSAKRIATFLPVAIAVFAAARPETGKVSEQPASRLQAKAPSLHLNPATYEAGGYSTISWKGTPPCTASASPDYEPWSGSKAADWAQSVAPNVTTVFTITCSGAASSTTLVVTGGNAAEPASGGSGASGPSGPVNELPPATDVPPTLAGRPSTTATIGLAYSFFPAARDANGDPLTFQARNLPEWARLDPVNGAVTGTPGANHAGLAANIVLSVSDGKSTVSLPSFSITVSAPGAGRPGEYSGFTYKFPESRPFISLRGFESVDRRSSAFAKLKAQADDAARITARLPAGAAYDQLVQSLNASHYGYSCTDSVVMYRLTGESRYIDQAIRMVDAFVTSENARIARSQTPRIAGDSYLEVGFYMEQLALAYDHGYARLSDAQKQAWALFAEQTIWNVWNPGQARWGAMARPWTGWSVDDPGNNYFYSFLKATQLWALASQNPSWLSFLQSRKYTQLVPFFRSLSGGGSREGTGYGTALGSLFENFSYWKDSTGEDLAAYSTHALDTIDYWIHATVPTFDYFASIGDQSRSAMPIMFDYQRRLVAQAVALAPESPQGQRGTWWLNRVKVTDGGRGWLTGMMRYNYNFRYDLLRKASAEAAPQATLYDASGVGVLFARSNWSTDASWMHTVAGPFDQSHAHQDQGSFSFYRNDWLSITANVFSRSGINQDVGVHNVIRFMSNGAPITQRNSVSSRTYDDDGRTLHVKETLSPAYATSGSRVRSWLRELIYDRTSHRLTVEDKCSVASDVTPVWQLQLPVRPVRQADGSFLAGRLHISTQVPDNADTTVVDMRTVSNEFTGGYRLEIADPAGGCSFRVSLRAN